MRNLKDVLHVRGLLASLMICFASASFAVELETIPPTSPLQGGACFGPRCFPTTFALDGDTVAYANTDPAVSVFTRSGAGAAWQVQQIIINPDFTLPPSPPDIAKALPFPPFGNRALALSGDYLLVAGTSKLYNQDVVYVFRRSNGQWQYIQVLAPTRTSGRATVITALAMDGDVALVSGVETGTTAPRAAVDVFILREGGTFLDRAIIRPPSIATVDEGYKLSISGKLAVIGDPNAANGNGRAYVYERSAAGWVLRRTVAPPAGLAGIRLGSAVAIDGNVLAISAPEQPIATHLYGAIHVYVLLANGRWQWDQLLASPQFENWPEPSSPPAASGWRFGTLITLDGDRLLASVEGAGWTLPPLAYLFERGPAGLAPVAEIADPETLFTRGLIVDASTLLLASTDGAYSTPVYVFELPQVPPR